MNEEVLYSLYEICSNKGILSKYQGIVVIFRQNVPNIMGYISLASDPDILEQCMEAEVPILTPLYYVTFEEFFLMQQMHGYTYSSLINAGLIAMYLNQSYLIPISSPCRTPIMYTSEIPSLEDLKNSFEDYINGTLIREEIEYYYANEEDMLYPYSSSEYAEYSFIIARPHGQNKLKMIYIAISNDRNNYVELSKYSFYIDDRVPLIKYVIMSDN